MNDGKHCPACGRDIGLWTVFTAGLPSRIHCPHCLARLGFPQTGVVVAWLIALGLVLSAGSYVFARRLYPVTRLEFHLLAAGLALVLLLAMNLGAAIYLRRTRQLVLQQATGPQSSRDT